jgi:hypothetical protein
MRIFTGVVSAAFALVCLAGPCSAGVTIVWTGSGTTTENTVNANGELQITLSGTPNLGSVCTITAVSGSNPISYINVKSSGSSPGYATRVDILEAGGTIPYIRTIEKISASPNPNSEVWVGTLRVSGDLGDPSSAHTTSIVADIVGDLICGGSMAADILAGPRLGGGTSTISNLQSGGDILGNVTAAAGGITQIEASGNISGSVISNTASIGTISAGGDISGPIKAESGSIGSIIADGDFTTPLNGSTFQVRAKNGIDTIIAHSITAYITACSNCTSSTSTGAGVVGLVKTTGGDFTHSIAMRSLSTSTLSSESGIIINGSLPSGALMRFITSGSVSQPITITGSLGGTIQYDSAGALTNQIIVNSANGSGTWGGSVLVDGITLASSQTNLLYQAPYYGVTASTLGGGAVGLAPFICTAPTAFPPTARRFPRSRTMRLF